MTFGTGNVSQIAARQVHFYREVVVIKEIIQT
jgi:hypothetical protein